MVNPNLKKRALIEGRPALIVIDIQKGTFIDQSTDGRAIDHMPDYAERMLLARKAIDQYIVGAGRLKESRDVDREVLQ